MASPIGQRMPSAKPPLLVTEDRALACTDPPFAVVQCARPDSDASVRASSPEHVVDHRARPFGAVSHTIDYGHASNAWPALCWSAELKCYKRSAFRARRMTLMHPLRANALTVFDASFAHHERIGNDVEVAATPGPCGGRMRRNRANVMASESYWPSESKVGDW